jgi:hypothetical protein
MKKLLILVVLMMAVTFSGFSFSVSHSAKNTTGDGVILKRYTYYPLRSIYFDAWSWRTGTEMYEEATYVILNQDMVTYAQYTGDFVRKNGWLSKVYKLNIALYAPFKGDWSYVSLYW